VQAKEGENGHDHHNQADEIDNAVHVILRTGFSCCRSRNERRRKGFRGGRKLQAVRTRRMFDSTQGAAVNRLLTPFGVCDAANSQIVR
jgi:hypothetical protein